MKEKTWLEFIKDNFIPGRMRDITLHIERVAIEQNFKPKNKNKRAKVRQILPEWTLGHPGQQNSPIFIKVGNEYHIYRNCG